MSNQGIKRAILLSVALGALCWALFAQAAPSTPSAPSPGSAPAAPPAAAPAAPPAMTERKSWAAVNPPTFVSIATRADNPARIALVFTLETGGDGADKASVDMADAQGKVLDSRLIGRSRSPNKSVEFAPSASGDYFFTITAYRTNESEAKRSEMRRFSFSLPLAAPAPRALNRGGGRLLVKWEAVAEAEGYELAWLDARTGKGLGSRALKGTEAELSGLELGGSYRLELSALRGSDRTRAVALVKTVRAEPDREWAFTWFGQSSKAELNTMEMIDADNLKFRLNSCSVGGNGQIAEKGGKFTAFHDGISYYYTVIDPEKENFELSATFRVDYINPVADGQEGFGILAMDSLGERGVSMRNHYSNSAGIIATKFEATVDGVKRTSKDTLGARFVSGLTEEVLAEGDSGIALHGRSVSRAFSYDRFDLVKAGDSYRLTLKKSNTGYHAIYRKEGAPDGAIEEFIMYGPDKLLQLDAKRVFVGFAVARGCNATISDVRMVVTDPRKDPPAEAEPPELLPFLAKIDSPKTFSSGSYPLVFNANANGKLSVLDGRGRVLVKDEPVEAGRDFVRRFELKRGVNDFTLDFRPDPEFRPAKGQALALYDAELLRYVEGVPPQRLYHSVIYHAYEAAELHVAPTGSFLGSGRKDDPLDLDTALAFAKAGQPIVLAGGLYYPARGVTIPRGNDGGKDARKILRSAVGERAIFDFRYSTAGMQLWGDYWTIQGIDVRNTIGDVKGLQVGGSENILVDIATYRNGDTGLQISGLSTEAFESWPRNNLVLNCTSYDNCDPAQNNADGFAAKLTAGEGNVFRGCLAYSNIDDGWDLFSKIESGPIGAVLIEDCVAFRNGSLSDGSGKGDGNGFKLGGDGIAVAHLLRNSIAYDNGASGITSNSDPAIIVLNNTSYGNGQSNISLYGKGDGARKFQARNNISMRGGSGDAFKEMPELASPDNYFWNGAASVNSEGKKLGIDIFANVDMSILPGRKPDGSIDMKGFLVKNDKAPPGIGANLE